MDKKTIEVSIEVYEAIDQLKGIFSQMSREEITSEEEVLWILISWFIESLKNQWDNWNNETDNPNIIS